MKQLPGLAAQRLMAEGYGFAGEGDWRTAALLRMMKVIAKMKGLRLWKIIRTTWSPEMKWY